MTTYYVMVATEDALDESWGSDPETGELVAPGVNLNAGATLAVVKAPAVRWGRVSIDGRDPVSRARARAIVEATRVLLAEENQGPSKD